MNGCLAWQKDGLGEPEEVARATSAYRAEMDILGTFIMEKCVEAPNVQVQASELFQAYCKWCEENGEHPVTSTKFGLMMTERGFSKDKPTTGKRHVFYKGIGLIDESH